MAGIPRWMLTHRATIEPFDGTTATGPVYGTPVEVRCYVVDGRNTLRMSDGREVVSTATLYAPLDTEVTTESRVTVGGRAAEVLSVTRHDGGGLPTPDHVEVALR